MPFFNSFAGSPSWTILAISCRPSSLSSCSVSLAVLAAARSLSQAQGAWVLLVLFSNRGCELHPTRLLLQRLQRCADQARGALLGPAESDMARGELLTVRVAMLVVLELLLTPWSLRALSKWIARCAL